MGGPIKKVFSGILFSFLFLFVCLTNVFASDAQDFNLSLGDVTDYQNQQISDMLYERFEIAGNDGIERVAFKAAFDSKSNNIDMVVWDDYTDSKHYKKATVMDIAKSFEEKTGRKVYAAVNGDFFMMSYPQDTNLVGKSLHTYMRDGKEIVYGWETQLTNFGFNNKGDYKIQTGVLTLGKQKVLRVYTNETDYTDFEIDKVNEMTLKGELGVYIPTSSKQINGRYTGKYIAKINGDDNNLPIEATIVRDNNQEILTNSLVDVEPGYIGLAVNSFGDMINGKAQFFYDTLKNGTKIEILQKERYINEGFNKLNYVVGGRTKLVVDGELTPEGTDLAVAPTGRHPRTTIGVTTDGKYFIQVIDGRQPGYSVGVNTVEQAQLAKDLGAIDAMELDGGGSSTFIIRVNDELKIVNIPSDKDGDGNHVERSVGNAILFVESTGNTILPEDKPNCEAHSDLDACKTVDPEPEQPGDETTDSNNDNTYLYVLIAAGAAVVLTTTGVLIKKKN